MSLHRPVRSLLAVTAALAFSLCHAAPGTAEGVAKDEIDHLLDYVAAAPCTFVRNGTEYAGPQAREHLAGKYRFAASRIATAEDFITYLGTASSMSGEPYHVKCGTTEALSGVWLTDELHRYRNARAQAQR